MKHVAAGLAVLGLFACTPKTEPPATETAAAKTPACSGTLTPITKVCTTDAALLADGDAKAELQDPKCVWKVVEAQRKPDEVVVFRAQDCAAGDIGLATYSFRNPQELQISQPSAAGPAIVNTIAYVFEIPDGKTAEDVAMTMLSEAPEAERARCKATPDETSGYFQLAPDEKFMAELKKDQDGPLSACGPFGYTEESRTYWEGFGKRAIFHSDGQDTPSWDPTSFRFYTRDTSGGWVVGAVTPPH